MYYLCENYYKPITVQYYIADCVSWVPRLTLLDLQTNWMCSQNGTHSYVGDLLYFTQFLVCFSVLLRGSFTEGNFKYDEIQFIYF